MTDRFDALLEQLDVVRGWLEKARLVNANRPEWTDAERFESLDLVVQHAIHAIARDNPRVKGIVDDAS